MQIVGTKKQLADLALRESVHRRLLRVYRAAQVLATGSTSLGNRMFREGQPGDLLFLRQALEEAAPWVRKEAGK